MRLRCRQEFGNLSRRIAREQPAPVAALSRCLQLRIVCETHQDRPCAGGVFLRQPLEQVMDEAVPKAAGREQFHGIGDGFRVALGDHGKDIVRAADICREAARDLRQPGEHGGLIHFQPMPHELLTHRQAQVVRQIAQVLAKRVIVAGSKSARSSAASIFSIALAIPAARASGSVSFAKPSKSCARLSAGAPGFAGAGAASIPTTADELAASGRGGAFDFTSRNPPPKLSRAAQRGIDQARTRAR